LVWLARAASVRVSPPPLTALTVPAGEPGWLGWSADTKANTNSLAEAVVNAGAAMV
jgi:hypothetical protein